MPQTSNFFVGVAVGVPVFVGVAVWVPVFVGGGVPLTQRSVEAPFAYPDRIIIYKRPIEAACASEREAVEQIRKTVLHEVGHFFGLDEADLDELGYG